MTDVDALRERPDVATWREEVPVDPGDFDRVRAALADGVDAWVSAVVRDAEGRVLLVCNSWSDGWIPPGGDVEPGEPLRTAARREVREETGVAAAVAAPVAVVEEAFVCDGRTASGPRVAFAATAETTALADDPGLEGEGIDDVGWFASLPDRVEHRRLVELARERA